MKLRQKLKKIITVPLYLLNDFKKYVNRKWNKWIQITINSENIKYKIKLTFLKADYCYINNTCYFTNSTNANNPKLICNPVYNVYNWTDSNFSTTTTTTAKTAITTTTTKTTTTTTTITNNIPKLTGNGNLIFPNLNLN